MHLLVFLLIALAQLSVAPKPKPVVKCGAVAYRFLLYVIMMESKLKDIIRTNKGLENLTRLDTCHMSNGGIHYILYTAEDVHTRKMKLFCIKANGTKDYKELSTDYKLMKEVDWWDPVEVLKDNQMSWEGLKHSGYNANKKELRATAKLLVKHWTGRKDNLIFTAVDYGFRTYENQTICAAIYRVEEKLNLFITYTLETKFIRAEYNGTISSAGQMTYSPQLLLKNEIAEELYESNEISDVTSVAKPKKGYVEKELKFTAEMSPKPSTVTHSIPTAEEDKSSKPPITTEEKMDVEVKKFLEKYNYISNQISNFTIVKYYIQLNTTEQTRNLIYLVTCKCMYFSNTLHTYVAFSQKESDERESYVIVGRFYENEIQMMEINGWLEIMSQFQDYNRFENVEDVTENPIKNFNYKKQLAKNTFPMPIGEMKVTLLHSKSSTNKFQSACTLDWDHSSSGEMTDDQETEETFTTKHFCILKSTSGDMVLSSLGEVPVFCSY